VPVHINSHENNDSLDPLHVRRRRSDAIIATIQNEGLGRKSASEISRKGPESYRSWLASVSVEIEGVARMLSVGFPTAGPLSMKNPATLRPLVHAIGTD
jgi:hypothetical protein